MFTTLAMLAAVAILAVAALVALGGWRRRLPLAGFAAAFTLAGLFAAVQGAVGAGMRALGSAWPLLAAAEVLAVAGAVAAPLMLGRVGRADRRALACAAVAALLAYGLLTGGASTTRILLLWNLGLAGWLPAAAYAAAAAGLAYTAVAARRSGHGTLAAVVVLLTCGGVGLHSTYQTGLVAVALALLALGATVRDAGGRTRPADEPRSAADAV